MTTMPAVTTQSGARTSSVDPIAAPTTIRTTITAAARNGSVRR